MMNDIQKLFTSSEVARNIWAIKNWSTGWIQDVEWQENLSLLGLAWGVLGYLTLCLWEDPSRQGSFPSSILWWWEWHVTHKYLHSSSHPWFMDTVSERGKMWQPYSYVWTFWLADQHQHHKVTRCSGMHDKVKKSLETKYRCSNVILHNVARSCKIASRTTLFHHQRSSYVCSL